MNQYTIVQIGTFDDGNHTPSFQIGIVGNDGVVRIAEGGEFGQFDTRNWPTTLEGARAKLVWLGRDPDNL